jgi:DNA-binding transcriptional ArsR family regulator
MGSDSSETVLGWLKAAGEDSRLRLLALCARQDLSVSDLAEALRQSEPRVSRHLRILCEAGLLERLRQGQWVHYRLTQNVVAAGFVQGLLAQVDRNDPLFLRDRERAFGRQVATSHTGVSLATALADRGARARGSGNAGPEIVGSDRDAAGLAAGPRAGAGRAAAVGGERLGAAARGRAGESRLGKALREVVEGGIAGVDSEGRRSALVVGVEHLELLETLALEAGECVAIAHSRRAAQSARAFAERRGFACRVLLAASSEALCARDVEAAGGLFDMVVLDHLAVPDSGMESLLGYGRRALAAGGRLWLFERYESLEVAREKVVEHPIGRLRRMLSDVGLTCERLSPIEADGEHVLAAVAIPSRGALRGTGAAGAA